ncbi:hypothetical protein LXA43DRAFT_337901 [Ganoderma leucocontextum]|nr:hypothetical protein LXA43DRAFT_337901 [Ganoderma leucocontextum]
MLSTHQALPQACQPQPPVYRPWTSWNSATLPLHRNGASCSLVGRAGPPTHRRRAGSALSQAAADQDGHEAADGWQPHFASQVVAEYRVLGAAAYRTAATATATPHARVESPLRALVVNERVLSAQMMIGVAAAETRSMGAACRGELDTRRSCARSLPRVALPLRRPHRHWHQLDLRCGWTTTVVWVRRRVGGRSAVSISRRARAHVPTHQAVVCQAAWCGRCIHGTIPGSVFFESCVQGEPHIYQPDLVRLEPWRDVPKDVG